MNRVEPTRFLSRPGLMELEGETPVQGPWANRVVGLNDVRADIAMMRAPDGHGRVKLTKFHTPLADRAEPEDAPANALGIRRIMFTVDDIDDLVARLLVDPLRDRLGFCGASCPISRPSITADHRHRR